MSTGPWTGLPGGVRVRRSAAFQMNSTLLLDAEHSIVVDPGVLPSELDDLARAVAEAAPRAITLLFTHAHWDHVLGRPWWPDAATLAHDRFALETRRDQESIRGEIEKLAAAHGERWQRGFASFAPSHAVSGLHFTRIGPWRLVLRDAPGHSTSQLSVHLPDRRVLIAADMLSDIEPPMLEGPIAPYRRTLEELRPLAEGGAIETLIPGHGSIARGRQEVVARLTRDLDYLGRLAQETARARRDGLALEAARERLSGMDVPGSPGEDTRRAHLENVGRAYLAKESAIKPKGRI